MRCAVSGCHTDLKRNLFGMLRSKGGLHDHPTALEFKYRLRSYILGRNENSFSEACNVEEDGTPNLNADEDLLSSRCFSTLADPVSQKDESSAPDPLSKELGYDGLDNLAGFICHKLKDEFEVASSSSLASLDESNFTWVSHLSEGGLNKPSEEFMFQFQQLEEIFNTFNPINDIHICKGYLNQLPNKSLH